MVTKEEFLIQGSDLVNRIFNGWYLANHKQEGHIDKTKQEFKLEIFEYNKETGLFLAKANDIWGNSGICGIIKGDKIMFEKNYPPKEITKEVFYTSAYHLSIFRKINYLGEIVKIDSQIIAGGDYHMEGYNEKTGGGSWRMDSLPIKITKTNFK